MAVPKRKLKMNKGKIKKIKLNSTIRNKYLYQSKCRNQLQSKLCFVSCVHNCTPHSSNG